MASPQQSDRYSRQVRFPGIGAAGQERLRAARVLVIGCGALGTVAVDLLARAGVGHVTIADRDFVELSNLQRQLLFDEADAASGTPKAVAAAAAVARINSEVEVLPVVADVTPDNVERLLEDAQVVLDGTDNFETRLLINDACVKHGVPWIYGGAIGSTGMSRASSVPFDVRRMCTTRRSSLLRSRFTRPSRSIRSMIPVTVLFCARMRSDSSLSETSPNVSSTLMTVSCGLVRFARRACSFVSLRPSV